MGSDVQSLLLKSVPTAPVVNLQPLQDRMTSMESNMTSGSDKLKHQVINLATNLGRRVGKIETAVKRLNARGFGGGGHHDAALDARIQNLERRVQELDSRLFKAFAPCMYRVLECRRRGLLFPAQRESSSPRSLQQGGNNGNNGGRLWNNGLSRSSFEELCLDS
jgi:hypothetical protein